MVMQKIAVLISLMEKEEFKFHIWKLFKRNFWSFTWH